MNRSLTKMESPRYLDSFSLLSALLLSLCSANAFANRPAMDEAATEATPEVVEDNFAARPTMEAATEVKAQPEAPSSVDLMMQQQTQKTYTTGDVVQLPPKEIQPGETLKIQLLDYPRRGMSMDKVQFEYGQPVTISIVLVNHPSQVGLTVTAWSILNTQPYCTLLRVKT